MSVHYDVMVLGGGINGCAIARKLSQEGKKVCLLERLTIGCGTYPWRVKVPGDRKVRFGERVSEG